MLRVALFLAVVLGAVLYSDHLRRARYEEQHQRFVECVKTGEKPLICSLKVQFTPPEEK